jgi:hypothetical protein
MDEEDEEEEAALPLSEPLGRLAMLSSGCCSDSRRTHKLITGQKRKHRDREIDQENKRK